MLKRRSGRKRARFQVSKFETPTGKAAYSQDEDGIVHVVTSDATGGDAGGLSMVTYKCSVEAYKRFILAEGNWSNEDLGAIEFIDAVKVFPNVVKALLA